MGGWGFCPAVERVIGGGGGGGEGVGVIAEPAGGG